MSCFDSYLESERARNVQTYDFTTLCTKLKHNEIKVALTSVVKLSFKQSKCKFISIYDKSFAWVNNPKESTFRFDEDTLLDSLEFLLNNCYFTIGHKVFRQITGVPIGVNPGPYIADLTLWYFENKYLDTLYKSDYFSARRMNDTFRLIDDITSVNSDGVFQNLVGNIYPESLVLNKENDDDSQANVLDLKIVVEGGKFVTEVYDKREDFPFEIVQYISKSSNVSRSTYLSIFSSQIIRYFRICSNTDSFQNRLETLINYFVSLNFDTLLERKFRNIARKHNVFEKFRNQDSLFDLFQS